MRFVDGVLRLGYEGEGVKNEDVVEDKEGKACEVGEPVRERSSEDVEEEEAL